ncbi:MAG: LOG family protein [bacterium]
MKKLVTIFGPSEISAGSEEYLSAEKLGTLLADAGFGVVNGGYEGIMEAVSKGAASRRGRVIGVTAEVYFARGREPNPYLSKELSLKSANDRLMELLDLADAYIAIGNSIGTLIEVATAWDYMLKSFMESKPLILVGKHWEELFTVLLAEQTFHGKEKCITLVQTPDEALAALLAVFGAQQWLPDLDIIELQST